MTTITGTTRKEILLEAAESIQRTFLLAIQDEPGARRNGAVGTAVKAIVEYLRAEAEADQA